MKKTKRQLREDLAKILASARACAEMSDSEVDRNAFARIRTWSFEALDSPTLADMNRFLRDVGPSEKEVPHG